MIQVKGLTKKYKDTVAVDRLDLTVAKGEIFALLGVNGAGKTTTIKMLSCLSKPTCGEAFLDGNSITDDAQKVKRIIGVSPQETAVAQHLTVFENLEFMCALYGLNRNEAKQKANKAILEFGLEEVKYKFAKTLSGGWARRLSIALALVSEPKILFLDEPTIGLDVLARREMWGIIRKLKGETTVILTTHYLEEAEQLADRIGIMAKGRLCALGGAKELISKIGADNFEDAFVKICEGEV